MPIVPPVLMIKTRLRMGDGRQGHSRLTEGERIVMLFDIIAGCQMFQQGVTAALRFQSIPRGMLIMVETAKKTNPPRPIPVDESRAHCAYANFCRVTGSPEELIVDFGLNAQ